MKTSFVLFGLLISFLTLTGCATKDPLARFYQSYTGEQKAWPTGPAGFVSEVDGILFYHGLPPRPYQIIGRFDQRKLSLHKLAVSAKMHGANAVCMEEHDITGIKEDNGALLWSDGNAVNAPKTTRPSVKIVPYAYLIKFNSP